SRRARGRGYASRASSRVGREESTLSVVVPCSTASTRSAVRSSALLRRSTSRALSLDSTMDSWVLLGTRSPRMMSRTASRRIPGGPMVSHGTVVITSTLALLSVPEEREDGAAPAESRGGTQVVVPRVEDVVLAVGTHDGHLAPAA